MKVTDPTNHSVHSKVQIATSSITVTPFLDDVRKSADSNTKALGFFPSSVYEEYARQGQLYVATLPIDGKMTYAGHLLFDRRFPRAHVLQMFCAKSLRKQGLGKLLLSALVERLSTEGFLSIQARVADELSSANCFWEAQGFYVQRTELGRGTKPRKINIRILELDTPQLFERSALATGSDNPLGLSHSNTTELPLYLVDLNVLFDLAIQRIRHEQVADIFRSVHAGHCRLSVSDEATRELNRTTRLGHADPMFELINTLPQFLYPAKDKLRPGNAHLTNLVFPDRFRQGTLTANDLSDIRHLETAIHHRLSGFITSDEAILRAAPDIEAQYGLRVLSPSAFKSTTLDVTHSHSVFTSSDRKLELRATTAIDEDAIRGLLMTHGLSAAAIAGTWLSPLRSAQAPTRFCAWVASELAGYVTWAPEAPGSKQTTAWAVVDERHPEAPNVARLLLRTLLDSITTNGPREIRLELVAHQSELRDYAHRHGFYSTGPHGFLVKIAGGRILTPENWRSSRDEIYSACNLKLPLDAPDCSDIGQLIDVLSPDGYRRYVPLDTLESHLSPVLLCLRGRPAVVTPIERRFAEPLLGHSPQSSLLPAASASLFTERHFLCGPYAIKHLRRGSLMLFYESGGSKGLKSIVAIGRITQAYLKRRDEVDISVLEKSALTSTSLKDLGASTTKAVAAIDNIFPLPRPVHLSFLRKIGCGDRNQLITTRPITDQQLHAILNEALANA
jgi:GNAT superfamily N-acetyltransferase